MLNRRRIMDSDLIMVLEAGNIVEYDSPAVLRLKKDGHLSRLLQSEAAMDLTADHTHA